MAKALGWFSIGLGLTELIAAERITRALGMEGKEAVFQGKAVKDVTDVDLLRHYAEDAGKSAEEIAAINEPETSWIFTADGVLIKK